MWYNNLKMSPVGSLD